MNFAEPSIGKPLSAKPGGRLRVTSVLRFQLSFSAASNVTSPADTVTVLGIERLPPTGSSVIFPVLLKSIPSTRTAPSFASHANPFQAKQPTASIAENVIVCWVQGPGSGGVSLER